MEERHGVDLGQGYKNNQACASSFVDCIRSQLVEALSHTNFFNLQVDDSENIEDELFLVVDLDHSAADHRTRVMNKFFSV